MQAGELKDIREYLDELNELIQLKTNHGFTNVQQHLVKIDQIINRLANTNVEGIEQKAELTALEFRAKRCKVSLELQQISEV